MKIILAMLCMLAIPIAAHADAITYNFTGIVVEATGQFSSAYGAAITGTYTFNLANASPSQSLGTVGSLTSNWQA